MSPPQPDTGAAVGLSALGSEVVTRLPGAAVVRDPSAGPGGAGGRERP